MAAEYQGQDPMVIAKQAERDLNSQKAPLSDSSKFPHLEKKKIAAPPSHLNQEKLTFLSPQQPKSPA
jgi:hypothetical protein